LEQIKNSSGRLHDECFGKVNEISNLCSSERKLKRAAL
jgi:hypothetical protein